MAARITGRLAQVGRILTPEGWRTARIEAVGASISAVVPLSLGAAAASELPRVVPGFLDLHCHGSDGVDVMGAQMAADWAHLSHGLASHGVTGFLATVLTAPRAEMLSVRPPVALDGAACLGVHWEGPHLSREWAGAQPPDALRPPDVRELESAWRTVPLVLATVAPELPGALDAIRALCAHGVRVNVGHSGATYEQAGEAFDAGADGVTHAFNAMPPWHHRRPNLLARAVDTPGVWIEAIVDGVHLHPATVRLLLRAANSRVVAVTDASRLAGTSESSGDLGGHPVVVRGGAAWLAHRPNTLAASVLTADRGVANLLAWGVPWEDAVRVWTQAPALRMGLGDRGRLAVGARADWVVLSEAVEVLETVVGGQVAFRRAG